MKTPLLGVALALTAFAVSAAATSAPQSLSGRPVDKAFAKGGAIRMKLTAGDYRIFRSTSASPTSTAAWKHRCAPAT